MNTSTERFNDLFIKMYVVSKWMSDAEFCNILDIIKESKDILE